MAEFLVEPHGLVDDALLLVVVADLDEAGQREVLAQRMPLEAVVGEDAAQVRMAGEQDAVEVVGFALEPVRRREHRDRRGHRRRLVGLHLHADATVTGGRQQMVDDVEALLARGIVDAGRFDEADEAEAGIVAQHGQHVDDRSGLRMRRSVRRRRPIAAHRAPARRRRLREFVEALVHGDGVVEQLRAGAVSAGTTC